MDGILVQSTGDGWGAYERGAPIEIILRPLWPEMSSYCWFCPFPAESSPLALAAVGDDESAVESTHHELAPHSSLDLFSSELVLDFTRYLLTDHSFLVGLRGTPADYLSELAEIARMVPDAGSIAEFKGRRYPVKEQTARIEDFIAREAELILACYEDLWIAVLTRREDFLRRLTKAKPSVLDELGQVQIESCDYSRVRDHFGPSP